MLFEKSDLAVYCDVIDNGIFVHAAHFLTEKNTGGNTDP